MKIQGKDKDNLDSIIQRLKEIQTNSEGIKSWEDIAIIWTDIASWTDVLSWMTKEIEKNQELKNVLKDIIIDLEEHRKAHSIEEMIKEEQKNRQIALELECKAEYYRGKADNYLKILKELDSCEKGPGKINNSKI